MRTYFNARQTDNDAVIVQYLHEGKSCEAAFPSWDEFITWLKEAVTKEPT